MMETRIGRIVEAGAYDADKMVAPKNLWVSSKHKELKDWFDERDKARQEKYSNPDE